MIEQSFRISCLVLMVSICSVRAQPTANESLVLTLSSVKQTYALREPVKFTAVLSNASDLESRIMSVRYLSSDMKYTYFEIVYPSGRLDYRRFRYISETEIINPNYGGERLSPGQSIYMMLYPNESVVLKSSSTEEPELQTFTEVGTYTIRLVYSVPSEFKNLQPYNLVISNPIEIVFREPNTTEYEILDACWTDGGGWFSMGEGMLLGVSEQHENVLRNVIAKYPDHPMTNYARLLLANSLMSSRNTGYTDRIEQALLILDELDEKNNLATEGVAIRFREPERAMLRTIGLSRTGKKEEAILIYKQILKTHPLLRTNTDFMWGFLVTEYGATSAVSIWWLNREKGVLEPDRNIEINRPWCLNAPWQSERHSRKSIEEEIEEEVGR